MIFKNYKIPLDFSDIVEPARVHDEPGKTGHHQIKRTGSLKASIDENIELLLTTRQGEYKHSRDFGFVIWDKEFENIEIEKFNTHNNPKQEFEEKLREMLKKYEPRLKNVQVEIYFIYKKAFKGKNIKYFVDLKVKGTIANKLEEDYEKSYQFAMGPLMK